MGDVFYRSKDPTNSIKVLKENATKYKSNNEEDKKHTCTDNNQDKKDTTQNRHSKSPSLR